MRSQTNPLGSRNRFSPTAGATVFRQFRVPSHCMLGPWRPWDCPSTSLSVPRSLWRLQPLLTAEVQSVLGVVRIMLHGVWHEIRGGSWVVPLCHSQLAHVLAQSLTIRSGDLVRDWGHGSGYRSRDPFWSITVIPCIEEVAQL